MRSNLCICAKVHNCPHRKLPSPTQLSGYGASIPLAVALDTGRAYLFAQVCSLVGRELRKPAMAVQLAVAQLRFAICRLVSAKVAEIRAVWKAEDAHAPLIQPVALHIPAATAALADGWLHAMPACRAGGPAARRPLQPHGLE